VRTRILIALLAAALVAGCGADEEPEPSIPAETAAALENQLDSIQDRFDVPGGQACGDITGGDDPNTAVVEEQIASVRDAETRDALQESFDRLFQLVDEECGELQQTETEPETETTTETTETTTETEPTDTTETEPPTTDTTETEPPTTDTLPTEPTVPPEGDDDGAGGVGPEEGL
jgi:hypothetical protein